MTEKPADLEGLLARLERVRRQGDSYLARCPAHEDKQPSLSIRLGDNGKILVHCHAGCTAEAIVKAVGLELTDLFPEEPKRNGRRHIVETYRYEKQGTLVFEVVRYDPKDFVQRRPDGAGGWIWDTKGVEKFLYRYDRVADATFSRQPVWIVEGESDVHALEQLGEIATCNPGGAGKWADSEWEAHFTSVLARLDVTVVADNDKVGREHGRAVAASLQGIAASVRVVVSPLEKKGADVRDHLAAGLTLEELVELEPLDAVDSEPELAGELEAARGSFAERVTGRKVDLFHLLEHGIPEIDYLPASDRMLIRGKRHLLPAPRRAGKTLTMLVHSVTMVLAGARVIILDVENGSNEYARRLGQIMAAFDLDNPQRTLVREQLTYYAFPRLHTGDRDNFLDLCTGADLVILDSSRRFLHDLGLAENDADDYATFMAELIDPLFEHRIATLILDNVGLADQTRGRGTSAKADLNEVQLTLEIVAAYSTGTVGKIRLRIEAGNSRFGNEGTWEQTIGAGVFSPWELVSDHDIIAEATNTKQAAQAAREVKARADGIAIVERDHSYNVGDPNYLGISQGSFEKAFKDAGYGSRDFGRQTFDALFTEAESRSRDLSLFEPSLASQTASDFPLAAHRGERTGGKYLKATIHTPRDLADTPAASDRERTPTAATRESLASSRPPYGRGGRSASDSESPATDDLEEAELARLDALEPHRADEHDRDDSPGSGTDE